MTRLPRSPFLYPILDTEFSTDLIEDAHKLIRAGVRILQLRAKAQSRRTIYELTVELAAICAQHKVCLIINDQVDVALVTEASGVHLGQDDFPADQARRLLGTRIIGLSTHNKEQFKVANQFPIDYIAIGPVYETTTKRSLNPVLGISNIIPLLKRKSKPVVAVGGIQHENLAELLSAGVDGIAVISALYRYGNVYDTACRLLLEIKRHEKI